ncbi:MAG: protein kinase [Actinomycetota bacterium]
MSTTAPPTPPQARPDPTGRPGVLGGRYFLSERIGSGGMGEVFRARDAVLDREVAVKLMHGGLAADPGFVARFRREAQAAASLHHPSVVDVYDWGDEQGTPYMVMELVRGVSLREALSVAGRLDPGRAAAILEQILVALERAHVSGIVHLDLKPENVLLAADGTVKVADFGLARATDAGTVGTQTLIGTAQYLAPERIRGAAPYPAADLYAVGIVAWELLVGRAPFEGPTVFAVAQRHLTASVVAPSTVPGVSDALDVWVGRLMAKDPASRPPTAASARSDLQRVGRDLPTAAPVSDLVRAATGAVTTVPTRLAPLGTRVMTARMASSPDRTRTAATERGRFRGSHLFVAVLVSIAAVAGLAFSVARARTATVPDVVGRSLPEAKAALAEVGLVPGSIVRAFHDAVPAGYIFRQSVASTQTAPKGSEIDLTVSRGPRPFALPDVVGMGKDDAVTALSALELDVVVTDASFFGFTGSTVVEQWPAAQTRVRPGESVEIFLD